MNTKKSIHTEIEAGPSKATLLDAFKYAYDKNVRINVNFSVAPAYTDGTYMKTEAEEWLLYGIRYEDGSGDRVIIEGSVKARISSSESVASDCKWYKFKMFYDAQKRTGHIEIFFHLILRIF